MKISIYSLGEYMMMTLNDGHSLVDVPIVLRVACAGGSDEHVQLWHMDWDCLGHEMPLAVMSNERGIEAHPDAPSVH